jgi:hypothetical protein
MYPSSTSRSGATRSGFPAKAEKLQYGEFPQAGEEGLKGSTCHKVWLESARKSAKVYAPLPRSPMPNSEGSEVTCSRIPFLRDFKAALL